MMLNPNDYFNPFSLPIFGQYDDYGALEEIEENENTRIIEQYFGIKIEHFIKIIRCGRSITSDMSTLFELYSPFIKHFKNERQLSINLLKVLGFKEEMHEDEKRYVFNDHPVYLKLGDKEKGEDAFYLYDTDSNLLYQNGKYDAKENLLESYRKMTGYLLHIPSERQEKAKLLEQLSGMFIHRDIYDELVRFGLEEVQLGKEYVKKNHLEELGFKLDENNQFYRKGDYPYQVKYESFNRYIIHKENHKNKTNFYTVEELIKKWNKKTGDQIDILPYTVNQYEIGFDKFKEWLCGEFDEQDFETSYWKEKLENETNEKEKELAQKMFQHAIDSRKRRIRDHFEYGRHLEGWEWFEHLYADLVKEGHLKEEFVQFNGFESSMDSCNRFFFPGMNGEQHGNLKASKMLVEKSLEIIQKQEREYDEEYDEDEEEKSME